ncbi:hypothetical protein FOCC_FOCC011939 [Frankliniella occidentalis]|nr:hypothetical protein FOCC_FOCC011939 [Frankliniella occidentalis]
MLAVCVSGLNAAWVLGEREGCAVCYVIDEGNLLMDRAKAQSSCLHCCLAMHGKGKRSLTVGSAEHLIFKYARWMSHRKFSV